MPASRPNVFIIDDEESIRKALMRLCRSAGYEGQAFESVQSFLDTDLSDRGGCVVADICMSDVSGLELPDRLYAMNRSIPVIFVTAFDTAETRAKAKEAGASAYFRKPVDDQALLDAIDWALEHPIESD